MPLAPEDKVCIASESSEARYLTIQSVTRNYNLHEFETREDAEAALLAASNCPLLDPTYPVLVRTPITVSSTAIADEWTASVTWENFIPQEVGREILSGSISLATQNVKTTYNHVGSYGPGSIPPMNSGGMINVTSEGANGEDVEFPVVTFTLARTYASGTFTLAFLATASTYVGLPNTVPWRGFGSGTVKLLGVDGSNSNGEFDEISFSFQASPTVENIVIPSPFGNITVPSKLGWQYLHIQSIEYHDESTGFTTQIPHTAHVDELGPGIDLNGLI